MDLIAIYYNFKNYKINFVLFKRISNLRKTCNYAKKKRKNYDFKIKKKIESFFFIYLVFLLSLTAFVFLNCIFKKFSNIFLPFFVYYFKPNDF